MIAHTQKRFEQHDLHVQLHQLFCRFTERTEPGEEEAFGYAFEKIVLFVQSLGVGTTWIAGTMDRSGFERAMKLNEDEVMPCVSPLGYEAKKMSLRETMMRKGVKADTRLPFASLFLTTRSIRRFRNQKPTR